MSSDVRKAILALPAAFLPEKAGNAKALFQLDLAGEGGGKWVLDVADGECELLEEVAANPDVTVTMDASDFVALLDNQLDPVQAFMGGGSESRATWDWSCSFFLGSSGDLEMGPKTPRAKGGPALSSQSKRRRRRDTFY